jgi:hypothetical protein
LQEKQTVKPTLHASPKLGAWLREVGGSLAFATYQSARLFILSAGAGDQTNVLERIKGAAMGLAVEAGLALCQRWATGAGQNKF